MKPVTARCLCGAVRFELDPPLREVSLCHCVECRRWHGHVCAMTSVPREQLRFVSDAGLHWIESPDSDAHARRGFCGECGSSLFWQPPGSDEVRIAVGALDRPTGLRVAGHGYAHQAGDWDRLVQDGLPRGREALRGIRWS
jgi:hypothetical protein